MAEILYPEGRILLFAKAPVPGRVKSRLRPARGAHGACHVYQELFRHTLSTACASGTAPLELWCSPGRAHPWLWARAREAAAPLRVQPPGDLGQRMHGGLSAALQEAPYALIIGADCAGLTPEHLRCAFAHLAGGLEAVFCPADDGGYLLVGLRRPVWGLFRNIPWGTSRVMQATRQRARLLGVHWAELEPAPDVDRPEDLKAFRRQGHAFGTPARSQIAFRI